VTSFDAQVISRKAEGSGDAVPWISNGFWGDYEGLAADDVSGDFVAAWSDHRRGGEAQVWETVFRP